MRQSWCPLEIELMSATAAFIEEVCGVHTFVIVCGSICVKRLLEDA